MRLKNLLAYRFIRFMRWVLPVVVLVLITIPIRYYIHQRRHAPQPDTAVQHLPKGLAAQTQGVTIDRWEGDRRLFTIHAKSNEGYKDNKGVLDDVDAVIYGKTADQPPRRVKSKQCDYDAASNDVRFYGDVQVQLDDNTTGFTQQLTYNHVTGLIVSDTRSHLERSGSTTGDADRLEYNSADGLMKLWGNVQVREGDNGAALDAGSAVFQNKENWATVADGVVLRSKNGIVRGQSGRAELTPQTFKPTKVDIEGGVTAESAPGAAPADTWKMRSPSMEVTLSDGRAQKLFARNQANAERGTGDSRRTLTAREIDTTFDDAGKVDHIDAQTAARLLGANQTLSSDRIQIHANENIETSDASTLQMQDRTISGRHFVMDQGETAMTFTTAEHSTMKSGSTESSSDHARARFDSNTNNLIELEQTGNFQFRDSQSNRRGKAQKATVTQNGDLITLEGAPLVNDDQMQLAADVIALNQKDNSFVATGNVKTLTAKQDQPALVSAKTASGNAATAVSYEEAVELWQGNAYIRSQHLKIVSQENAAHETQHHLYATGNVRSNLGMVVASAENLDYDENAQTAHYTVNVHARKQDMTINSADMVVKMVDNAVSQIVSSGKVTVDVSSTRHGSGDHAVYEAKTDVVTLSGPSAQMTDPERGLARAAQIVVLNASDKKLDKMRLESDGSERASSQQKVKKP